MQTGNSHTIRTFADAYAGEVAPIGETVTLPDNGQSFEIIAHVLLDYGAGHVEPAGYQWAGPCAACGQRHMFTTSRAPRYLKRVCPEHAGQWRAPAAPDTANAPREPKTRQRSALQQLVIDTWEALRLARGDVMPRETLVTCCVERLPAGAPGTRDVRRQNVQRAIDRLLRPSLAGRPPIRQVGVALFPGAEDDSN